MKSPTWTRAMCVDAIKTAAVQFGRTPRALVELEDPSYRGPSRSTCIKLWGTWRNLLRAAELELNTTGPQFGYRRARCKRGHALTPENTYSFTRKGRSARHGPNRRCITCDKMQRPSRWQRYVAGMRGKQTALRELRAFARETRVRPDVAVRHSPEALAKHWGLTKRVLVVGAGT